VAEPRVLLVGHPRDEHSDYVEEILRRRGRVIISRLSRTQLPETDFSWEPDGRLQIADESLEGTLAGWWRRPGHPQDEGYSAEFSDFVLDETRDAFDGALVGLDVNWITHPSDVTRAELKLSQLKVARDLGVPIPATLVTNSTRDAVEFAKKAGEVVAKPVRYGLLTTGSKPLVAFTSSVTASELGDLSGPPIILQAAIRADAHLRVITVGGDVFISRLRTPELDWRENLSNHERFAAVSGGIFPTVEGFARSIATRLGLGFSAQDWISATDGSAYFLEANPSGQWLFLETGHEGKIGLAIAKLLEQLATEGSDGHLP
jgi:glutathione synthase/RimK-type ligase-like ATP-grasp enzyme